MTKEATNIAYASEFATKHWLRRVLRPLQMAYNLYSVQMARAWAERIDKETAQQEKFWADQALKSAQATQEQLRLLRASEARSTISSAAPSGYTSKTSFLKDRLGALEDELRREKEMRRQVEKDLLSIKTGLTSKPGTPSGSPRP